MNNLSGLFEPLQGFTYVLYKGVLGKKKAVCIEWVHRQVWGGLASTSDDATIVKGESVLETSAEKMLHKIIYTPCCEQFLV